MALCLPGLSARAASPATDITSDVSYGHYAESGKRMTVDIYHADATLPLTDDLELSFSLDRDTYGGASPAYSLPTSMTNQPKYDVTLVSGKINTSPQVSNADIVASASPLASAAMLTTMGLDDFVAFQLANTAAQTNFTAQQNQADTIALTAYNDSTSLFQSLSAVTLTSTENINFGGLNNRSFFGDTNLTPSSTGGCPVNTCYQQGGMLFGAVWDPSEPNLTHFHTQGGIVGSDNYSINSESDANGLYFREQSGTAFSLNSLYFSAPISSGNPNQGANAYWQILGFNTAINPNLASGNGTSYATETAYQTVANGTVGTVTLSSAFQDVNAVWIHYVGYPEVPQDGTVYQFNLDNVNITNVIASANTPSNNPAAMIIGLADNYEAKISSLESSAIATQINSLTKAYDANIATINPIIGQYDSSYTQEIANISNYTNQYASQISALTAGTANAGQINTLTNGAEQFLPNISTIENAYQSYQNSLFQEQQTIKQLNYNFLVNEYSQLLNSTVPSGTAAVQRFQIMPLETRSQPQFNLRYFLDETTLGVSGGQSEEPDFLSNFGSVNLSREFNDKLTTVSGSYSLSSNSVGRNAMMMNMQGMNNPSFGPTQYPVLNGHSEYNAFGLSVSQVIDKNTLFQSSINYTNQNGYLSNPYKDVYIRGILTPADYANMNINNTSFNLNNLPQGLQVMGVDLFRENRPNNRNIWSFSNQINHNISQFDATVHFDYRFYIDDWGVDSHTFQFKWYQSVPWGVTVTPTLRYYSQSQADFFAPYYLAPRADGYYSSDYRLSAFGELGGGVILSKKFAKGVKLDAGFEYVTHAGGLKLGGGGVGNYADFDYYMAHANLNVDLSAKTFAGLEGEGVHAMHHRHHHGAPLPAGVMFGHMMQQADDIMVGYRFMYSRQRGDMLNGSSLVSNQTLIANACPGSAVGCIYKPLTMNMQMHMLDLMYAPTDWLNLMVMPQLMSMDMAMSTSLTGAEDATMPMGGKKMISDNMGDTIVTALLRGWDGDGHHVHIGAGVSAPTGSIKQLMGGTYSQGYGMQAGSGTWDLKPSLTYTGQSDEWGWGAQFSGVYHTGKNRFGYTLGDQFQVTGWGSYQILNWLSASLRGVYTQQDGIHGLSSLPQLTTSPGYYTGNYGGRFLDAGFGLNATIQQGQFAGHNLSLEWLQPVSTDFNGYQLDRNGALSVSWSYAF